MKFAKWFLMNAFFLTCLVLGLCYGITGFANVGLVIAWMTIIAAILITTDTGMNQLAKDGYTDPIPRWLEVSFDLVVAFLITWHGWFFTGAFYIVHMLFLHRLRREMPAVIAGLKRKQEIEELAAARQTDQATEEHHPV